MVVGSLYRNRGVVINSVFHCFHKKASGDLLFNWWVSVDTSIFHVGVRCRGGGGLHIAILCL